MREEDKNTEEVAGSDDSNWVSKELGKEEDDEEGELLEGALNIFIGPEQGCIFFPKIEFFINHYLEH